MHQKTNIITDDEVAQAMAAASQTKGKRGKQKATGGFSFSTKPQTANSIPRVPKRPQTATSTPRAPKRQKTDTKKDRKPETQEILPITEQASPFPLHQASPVTIDRGNAAKDDVCIEERLIGDTEIDAFNLDRSTVVIRGESENQVVTTTSNPRTGASCFFDTAVTQSQSNIPQQPAPFLKKGRHGRHGDFVNDPDRLTGHGHQIPPGERRRWDEFTVFRGSFCRTASGVPSGQTKEIWNKWQMWYSGFVERFPGYAVAHLWPCGCERVSDDSDSEEE